MSRQSVQRILGKPHKSFWSKKFAAQEIIYSRQTRKNREGMWHKWTNYYLFKDGKLYFIELSRDHLGGG